MPNLNLSHSGNMNITSASLGSGGTLNVQYEPNLTGAITGWTHNQTDPLVCGETYTILLYPQFSGTVLTENFTVSGVDIAGVSRSDTSVLRQGFNKNLRGYITNVRSTNVRMDIHSWSVTESYIEVNATVVGYNSGYRTNLAIYWVDSDDTNHSVTVFFDVEREPDTGGTVATSITLNVASTITDSGQATASYSWSGATVNLVYSSSDTNTAVINPITGEISVLGNGTVQICVTDTISNLSDCKYVDVFTTERWLEVTYNVTSTTEPTWLFMPEHFVTGFTKAMIGSEEITYEINNGYYTFPSTGNAIVRYRLYRTIIPSSSFLSSNGPDNGNIVGVNIPDGVTVIENQAFSSQNIASLVLPSSVSRIEQTAFQLNTLQPLVLNEGLVNIEPLSFHNVQSESITIPSTVESFAYDRLYEQYGDESYRKPGNPFTGCRWLSSFSGRYASDNSRILVQDGVLVSFAPSGLTSYVIPNNVTKVAQYAFGQCSNLTEITIPDTVTEIMDNAFVGCYGLTSVTIPSSVTSIGGHCFEGCYGLTEIVFESTVPPTILYDEEESLGSTGYTFPIYVPCEAVDVYKAAYPTYSHRIFCVGQEETYATSIQLVISNPLLDSGTASVTPVPAEAVVYPVYSSSNPEIASVDVFTGEITVYQAGSVTITARDVFTNIFTDETISVVPFERVEVKTTGTSGYVWSNSAGAIGQEIGLKRLEMVMDDGTIQDITSNVGYMGPGTSSKGYLDYSRLSTGTTHTLYYCYEMGANPSFYIYSGMVSIIFPEGMTSIYVYGGSDRNGYNVTLKEITIPSTVTLVSRINDVYNVNKIYAYPTTAPALTSNETFLDCGRAGGKLYYPAGSNYSVWLQNRAYYLGYNSTGLHTAWTGSPTL